MKKKIIIIAAIIIGFAVIGVGCSKDTPTKSTSNKKTTSPSESTETIKDMPLGTKATKSTGRIYVDMKKKFVGITGMGNANSLMVFPSLSGGGYDIGSYGVAYYNPNEITDKSLIEFTKDVVNRSNCNYITLINSNDPSKGLTIISDPTYLLNTSFTKGVLKEGFTYSLKEDTSIGFIKNNKLNEIEWKNPNQ